jgi:glycosyltransferase involved in cell wall biosynthesis
VANILFVLDGDLMTSSGIHVRALAHYLSEAGHHCVVAVPDCKSSVKALVRPLYKVTELIELIEEGLTFPDQRGPDIVHAWTPRRIVQSYCSRLARYHSFKLIIHLENHEEQIFEGNVLEQADGVTVATDTLKGFVPEGIPVCEIPPGADGHLFKPGLNGAALKRALRIPEDHAVTVYAGNVHQANAREVRSLYLAVALLNREGCPTTLVRAGIDYQPTLDGPSIGCHTIDLGYLDHKMLPHIYSLADFFVQPGRSAKVNDYRVPAKLAEFFAMGKPVILPKTNVGRHTKHGVEAFVLPVADATNIVDAVKIIMNDGELYQRLAEGARRFFERHLSWPVTCRKLVEFYSRFCKSKH